jgi:hypothetical protein
MWNTGCRMIGNGLRNGINILDGENQGYAVTVPSAGAVDFNNVIFPWCNNGDEVTHKAFRVSDVVAGTTKPFMYLFQEYTTNKICWSFSDTPWDKRMVINDGLQSAAEQVPLSSIDIYILADRVWGTPATNNNTVFLQVLNEAIAIVGTAGQIAQAAAGIVAAAAALTSPERTRVPPHEQLQNLPPRVGR